MAALCFAGKKITYINATWIVPSNPTEMTPGNAPGWWYVPCGELGV